MLIFSKNHENSNFPKNRNIGPKCMKLKYDQSKEMFFRFALPEHTSEPFGGRISMHMVISGKACEKNQDFDFQTRAHSRARIMARAHGHHRMRNFIFFIPSTYIKSIGPIVFDVDRFFTKKTQTGWRVKIVKIEKIDDFDDFCVFFVRLRT